MRKLNIFLLVFIFVFVGLISSISAAPAYVNVGPTTEFNGDIKIIDEIEAEGSTPDEFETVLTFTNPTADRVITVPDSDQTIGTATVITDGLILEADLNADEEPANNDILTFDETGANFSWQTPGELDLVTVSGEPADSQVAVWTADGVIEGAASLTYDGANLQLTGDIGSVGTPITKIWATDLTVTNDIAGSITGNAETVTFADNDATAEENEILFAAGAAESGDGALEGDSDFTYNPSTGTVTATEFVGGGVGLTGVVATANYIQHFMDIDAAQADYVHAAITGTGASQDVSTAITNPDYGRVVTVTCSNVNSPAGDVTITGTLADGTTGQTDAITITPAGTAIGVKPFVYITNINTPAGLPADDNVTIGIGDVLGLQNAISAEADIYLKTVDGVEEYGEIATKANTTYNTLDCSTIAQNEDITIYYHP